MSNAGVGMSTHTFLLRVRLIIVMKYANISLFFRFKGAAWMHETSQNKLTKLIPKLGVDYYYDDGAPLYYTPYGKAGAQFKAKKVADEFADYCEWFYKNNPDAEDKSVDELVRSFVKKHDLITEDERLWAPQATREVSKRALGDICLSRPRRNY